MNIDEIKAGETYNVRVKVNCFNLAKNAAVVWDCGGHPCYFLLEDFSPISHENGIKNTDTTPKYDPCRIFRKGDKVKAVLRHGRIPNDGVPKDVILEVIADERDGIVKVLHKMGVILEIFNVYALYLELVTPVEERVRYRVGDFPTNNEWCVWKDSLSKTEVVSSYKIDTHPNAKAAAEAERDRLNAEYRKEQENGQNG